MYPCAPLQAPPTRTGFSVAAIPELFVSLTQCNPPFKQYSPYYSGTQILRCIGVTAKSIGRFAARITPQNA